MEIAVWVIAICSLVRIIQNGIQISMRKDNREWAEDTLKRFVKADKTPKEKIV